MVSGNKISSKLQKMVHYGEKGLLEELSLQNFRKYIEI